MKLKKLLFLFISLMMVTTAFSSCDKDDDKFISYEQLPVGAKQFLAANFGQGDILSVQYDKDLRGAEYEVEFMNGAEISFDKNGNWDEIYVPAGIADDLVPEKVLAFVQIRHPQATIVKMDKDKREFDVQLNNRLELVFDNHYNFLRYDD